MKISREERQIFFRLIQENSSFAGVPVNWAPKNGGPKLRVSRQDERVRIQINVRGVGLAELDRLARKGLKHAKDIHSGVTSASAIGIGLKEKEESDGIKWAETERGREEQRAEILEGLREGLSERIEERLSA